MRKAALTLTTSVAIMMTAIHSANAEITWQDNLRSAHATAQREGKLLLLHFYADNCSWCDRLEEGSFQNQDVGNTIGQSFVPVKIHANKNPKLAEMFKVTKFPTDVIVSVEGKTLSHSVSPQEPTRYVAMLSKALPALVASKQAAPKSAEPTNIASIAGAVAKPSTKSAEPTSVAPSADALDKPPATSVAKAVPSVAPSADEVDKPSATSVAKTVPSYAVSDGYAVSDEPTEPAVGDSIPKMKAPGVEAKLAASRTEKLSFEMPTVADAAIPEPTDVAELSEALSSSVEITAPEIESPKVTQQEPKASSTKNDAEQSESQPELAMQGFCPVTVINEDRWVEGKPEFGVIHLGKLYLFAEQNSMDAFLADPIPFTPVLNEIDVVRFFEERKIVPGKREWGLKDPVHNRMFFFADEAAMNHFYEQYERYTDAAIDVMKKAVKEANPES